MATQTVTANTMLAPDSTPSISRSSINQCAFSNLTPADTIRRSKLNAVTITSYPSLENHNRSNVNAPTPHTTSIIRSDISNSALAHVSARHSTITNSTLTNVASARRLDAKGSRFENVRSVRRSSIKDSNVTGQSSVTRSTVRASVITDGSSVRRSTLDSVQMAGTRVKRSTLRDCDVRDCIIHRTDFKGVVLRNEVWKNGRLVGRIGPSQGEQVASANGEKIITQEAKVWMEDESASDSSDDESVQSKGGDLPPPYSP